MGVQSAIQGVSGLTDQEVTAARVLHGLNEFNTGKGHPVLISLRNLISDPMLALLLAAALVYMLSGGWTEGISMMVAIVFVASISLYQEARSRNALAELKAFTQPKCKLIRNGKVGDYPTREVVIGDSMIVEEGSLVPADGALVRANDFGVNEAILTGESMPLTKGAGDEVYQGTQVVAGLAIGQVTQIGGTTKLGQIGKSLIEIKEELSPLQIQIRNFVKGMAGAGALFFVAVWGLNFAQSGLWLDSLLKSLTLAMSILPEEIPVAFTTFMALGAWRMMKLGIIVRQAGTIEALGSVSVLCVDKTGTLTKNEMSLKKVYVHALQRIIDIKQSAEVQDVITSAMWASEPIPFDPMEKAIHQAYASGTPNDLRPSYSLAHEYPLSGKPPFMTHVFRDESGHEFIAAKGAPEAVIRLSILSPEEKKEIMSSFEELAREGYRVLGVGEAKVVDRKYPPTQEEFNFTFKGLVAFYDPPKDNIERVIQSFYDAGITVKVITGDNEATTLTIVRQIGLRGSESSITGEALMPLSDAALTETVRKTNVFARMFPEAKLKIIESLKADNQVVAMIGDGVNDGPALKAAHVGIAMGKKGSETAKQASALVISDDDLSRVVDGVAMGRKIYNNLKKAIRYIISIHIPIILIVFIPLVFNWPYPALFTPVHIIFLELLMGPTCSVIYENEPIEQNLMSQRPRVLRSTFFSLKELTVSMVQGLAIAGGLIFVYWILVRRGESLETTTTSIFVALISANIMLTLVNRSFDYSLITTLAYKNRLIPFVILITISLTVLILLFPPARHLFRFGILPPGFILMSTFAGVTSVVWFEGYKWLRRMVAGSREKQLNKEGNPLDPKANDKSRPPN